ncbi:MAG: NB-ARC domain-containing protein [Actinomycetia bacterium]|nr:NB-ARC domain-containing protein [Actinomycetes bacterium]
MLARYGQLVGAGLTVADLVVPGAGAAGALVSAALAVVGATSTSLEKEWKKACRSLEDDLQEPRRRAGGEAEVVEARVLGVVTPFVEGHRSELLRAALEGPDEFRAALPAVDLVGFAPAACHYADRIVGRLGYLARQLALSSEVYPGLNEERLKEVLATVGERFAGVEARLDGADQERADLQSQQDELREAVAALKQELDRRPSRIVEVGSMPRRAAHFVERSDLGRVREALADAGTATLCAVSGMRGVGKSQLAVAFAEQCINDMWSFVAWVSATSRAATITQMAQIARGHRLIQGDEAKDDEKAAQRLVSWLSGTGPDPRLLVFDNVESADDLAGLTPKGPGMRVLVTTTARTDALGKRIDVDVYTPEEAIGYLVDATGNPDRDGAKAVAEALGYLPVALTQAAATVQHRGYTYSEYLKVLKSRSLDEAVRQTDGDPYPVTVGVALRLWLGLNKTVFCGLAGWE